MVCCAVFGCYNKGEKAVKKDQGVTYHQFPRNPERKRLWLKAIRRSEWVPPKNSCVCSVHFTEECFYETEKGYRRLSMTAVPSLFLPQILLPEKSVQTDWSIPIVSPPLSTIPSTLLVSESSISEERLQPDVLISNVEDTSKYTQMKLELNEFLQTDWPITTADEFAVEASTLLISQSSVSEVQSKPDGLVYNVEDTPKNKKLKSQVLRYKELYEKSKKTIKRLQQCTGRQKKRINHLKSELKEIKEIKEKKMLSEDEFFCSV